MKIINLKDVEEKEVEDGPLFTGGKVFTHFALEEDYKAEKIQVVNVRFEPGARNRFHIHSIGQILYVTEGKGIVATRDKEHVVTAGMLILVEPGEEHWHGATKDTSFAHLSIIGQPHEMEITEK